MTTTTTKPADAEALREHGETAVYFNGKLSFRNLETGEHRTLRISTQKDDAKFAPGQRIVSLLTGADNDSDYTGFAFADDNTGIRIWRKKRSGPFPWYALMVDAYFRGSASAESGARGILIDDDSIRIVLADGSEKTYVVHLERKCSRCNRTLTVPESIDAGIGPICLAKLAG
jgi:hypothetical protein